MAVLAAGGVTGALLDSDRRYYINNETPGIQFYGGSFAVAVCYNFGGVDTEQFASR